MQARARAGGLKVRGNAPPHEVGEDEAVVARELLLREEAPDHDLEPIRVMVRVRVRVGVSPQTMTLSREAKTSPWIISYATTQHTARQRTTRSGRLPWATLGRHAVSQQHIRTHHSASTVQ